MTQQPTMVRVDQLIPYDRNAKKHPDEQINALASMLLEFGFDQPIVCDGNMVIIKGHGRRLAAIKAGIEMVPVIVRSDLSAAKVRASRIADNKIAETDWDTESLISDLKIIREESDDLLEKLGFDDNELDALLSDPIPPGKTDPDEIPQNVETRCKPGDLWILGNHRLLCGDSTNVQHVERLMGGEKAHITFTSPPYNAGVSAQLRGNTSIEDNLYGDGYDDNKTEDEWLQFVSEATMRSLAHSRYAFWNVQFLAGNRTALPRYWASFKDQICDVAIWNKGLGAPQQAARVLNSAFEFVFIFTSDQNPTRAIRCAPEFRGSIQNVFDIPPQRSNEFAKIHAATFPAALPEAFVSAFCPKGGSTIDLFCGTGTTLIACEKNGRRCFGMEIDPKYCDVILSRWEQFTGKTAKLADPSPHVFPDGYTQDIVVSDD